MRDWRKLKEHLVTMVLSILLGFTWGIIAAQRDEGKLAETVPGQCVCARPKAYEPGLF